MMKIIWIIGYDVQAPDLNPTEHPWENLEGNIEQRSLTPSSKFSTAAAREACG